MKNFVISILKGSRDGEIKMAVGENQKVFAFVWSNDEHKWVCQGEVTGSHDDGSNDGKKTYKGKKQKLLINQVINVFYLRFMITLYWNFV